MRIAVAGATGKVGRHVVEVLAEGGHEVVALSRGAGVDLETGSGLKEALAGVECIVDAANGPPDQAPATAFFTAVARNLQHAGARAGARRIVAVSILGIDRFRAGYMVAKQAHEHALREGPLPVQVLRAAQFHEIVGQFLQWGTKGEVAYLPRMRTQLVAARTVAEQVARLATDPPPAQAGAPYLELAGPRPEVLADAARKLVARRGDALRIEEVGDRSDPDQRLYEDGAFLAGPATVCAGPTFDAWLEAAL